MRKKKISKKVTKTKKATIVRYVFPCCAQSFDLVKIEYMVCPSCIKATKFDIKNVV